ncbi:MAG: glycosyltransferase family 9 protein [Spirochaetia bacterium]|nr:glycosyltransferase family 9 protein [Spirochaetia bacterium]
MRIAVIKTDGIGDAVLASPFFLGLRKKYKDARITAFLSPAGSQVLDGLNCFDEVRVFDALWLKYEKKSFITRWFSALKLLVEINRGRYDMVIGMRWQDRLTSLIMSLCNAPQKYGYNTGSMGYGINNIAPHPPMSAHVTRKNMLLLEKITGEKYPPKPFLKTDQMSEDNVSALLKKGNIGKYIVLHPVSGHSSKDWDIKKYDDLAMYLSRGIKVIITGAKNDKGIDTLRGRHVVNLAGMLNVRETKALIKHAALVIGNDSAAVHIASAFGVKSLTIFSGSARYQEWGAYGDRSYIIDRHVKCSPCGLAVCNRKDIYKECLEVPVDFVARTALQILEGKQKQRLISFKPKD